MRYEDWIASASKNLHQQDEGEGEARDLQEVERLAAEFERDDACPAQDDARFAERRARFAQGDACFAQDGAHLASQHADGASQSDKVQQHGRAGVRTQSTDADSIAYEVLSVVSEIPAGKVASYGQLARLIGRPKNARLVGKVLSCSEYYGRFPCHRVVNHAGRTAPGWPEQRALLEDEGVEFRANGLVDMRRFGWDA